MPRRKIQEILAEDLKYTASFVVSPREPPVEQPPREPLAPQPQDREPPANPDEPKAQDTASEAQEVRPFKPAAVPAPAHSPARTPKPYTATVPKPQRAQARAGQPRQVSIRLRPLATQADRLAASGFTPRKVMRAAWRKATADWTLGAAFIEPSKEERVLDAEYLFATSLTVDADTLTILAREHDPLGIEGTWWLMRGQVEPAFWTALDDTLTQLAKPETSQEEAP